MRIAKQVLRPERLRQVPEQFSWVDQALVQCGFIDRCDARAAALYLFLVTVADAQGLSYYGAATLAGRLHLSAAEFEPDPVWWTPRSTKSVIHGRPVRSLATNRNRPSVGNAVPLIATMAWLLSLTRCASAARTLPV